MKLSIGDVVHHSSLDEEGRIVRVATLGKRIGYVVATVNKSSGAEIEALWLPREVKELKDGVRKYRAATSQ
jgi:hypothetical protein